MRPRVEVDAAADYRQWAVLGQGVGFVAGVGEGAGPTHSLGPAANQSTWFEPITESRTQRVCAGPASHRERWPVVWVIAEVASSRGRDLR